MSVINQVLTQLARRGVHVEPEQDLVRAVSPPSSRGALFAVALALLLAGMVGWWLVRGVDAGGAKQRALQVAAAIAPAEPAKPDAASGISAPDHIASAPVAPVVASAMPAAIPHSAVRAAPPVAPVIPRPLPQPVARVAAQSAPQVAPKLAAQAAAKPVLPSMPKPAAQSAPKPIPKPAQPPAQTPVAVASISPKPPAQKPSAQKIAPQSVAPPANRAEPKPQAAADKPGEAAPMIADGGVPIKQVSRGQQAEAEFRKGLELKQQGRKSEAMASYSAALQLDGAHDAARQALAALLLEEKRGGEAEQLLQERLKERPEHTGFAMLLARLQVERGATSEALVTLERSAPHAQSRADYLAFLAALQQRSNRHAEAISHYQAALQLQPGNGPWLVGYGISLQALLRTEEAKAAYKQALESKNLSPDLKAFVQRKLNAL